MSHSVLMCYVDICYSCPPATTTTYALVRRAAGGFGLIPSEPPPALVPSTPVHSPIDPSDPINLGPTPFPPGLVLSQLPKASQESPLPHSALIPSASAPPGSSPSTPLPTLDLGLISSAPAVTDERPVVTTSQANATGTPVMQSTDQGLKPIPPAATQTGDPNGHHEITEPNFTATRSCRGCSPVIEVTASGWLDIPAGEQHGTTEEPAKVTISAGLSNMIISPAASGGNIMIGDSITLTPGQTVTVDDTPIVIRTSGGRTEVIVGTTIIPLKPDDGEPRITDAPSPLPPILTIGTNKIEPNAQTQYVISGQTLTPGGEPLTISGTTISLAPSATALVVDGKTSSITPTLGAIYTTVVPVALIFHSQAYTTNHAGYIIMGPGTTLVPGGSPVTVDGTTLSFQHSGTAVVVQGITMALQPVTTVVTLTRGPGSASGGGSFGQSTSYGYTYPTEKPVSGSAPPRYGCTVANGKLGGLLMLIWWGMGYFAIRL
ncbi:hypothetical protein EJ02DRAFT_465220 [Clathrospora elynae]|uniref:Uncharacterized protein n=1 Tax=Clathrospora elynae TaxID=706981 RepID=A0A6A5STH4_9PLEO|nr:hypothetical protein EJ02DRAFT_465220 [Clathrospora elynae]